MRVFFVLFCPFVFSWATTTAYEASQARGPVRAVAPAYAKASAAQDLSHVCDLNTTAHRNTGSLTHWVKPGIEPATSRFLVGFVNHWATTGTPRHPFWMAVVTLLHRLIWHPDPFSAPIRASLATGAKDVSILSAQGHPEFCQRGKFHLSLS